MPELAEPGPGATTTNGGGAYRQELSRSLTFRGTVLITLSAVTPASSVFIIVPAVILAVGGASVVAFVVAALVGVLMAFCYGELASAFPIAGGEYSFAARVLGRGWGFALFLMNALSITLIIGVIALGTGDYLSVVFSAAGTKWAGVIVIVLATLIAICNIRANAWITGCFLAIEILALVILSALGFLNVSQPVSELWHAQTATDGNLGSVGAGIVAAQVVTAIFAYNGYGAAIYFAEETKGASKTIAKTILLALGITVAAELIPLIAVILGSPSMKGLLTSEHPMTWFVLERGGSTLNTIISLGIAIAIINAVVAIILQAGRTIYGSARDHAYPAPISRALAYVSPTLRTPVTATLFVGILAAAIAAVVSLDALIVASGATLVVLYAIVAISAIIGRRNGTTAHAKYRMPLWPLPPVLVLVVLVYVIVQLWQSNPWQIVIALAALGLGYLYYVVYLRSRRDSHWTMAQAAPPDEDDLEFEKAVTP